MVFECMGLVWNFVIWNFGNYLGFGHWDLEFSCADNRAVVA